MHTSKYEKNGSKVVQISPFWVGPNVHFTPAKNYAQQLLHADCSNLDFNGFYMTAIDQFKADTV